MRVAYIAAGAAGMYCGTCLHDNTVAVALKAAGHDVALLPTYTPLRTEAPDASEPRIFYGALNVFLQQQAGLFGHLPRFLERLLDRPGLLHYIGRFGGSTDPRTLGPLTLSVLDGERGRQAHELAKLVDWLEVFQPDLVHLTNSMFLGFTRQIKARLGVPVVCGLTGEDIFLDELPEPWHGKVLAIMRERAAEADGFLATSRYYAGYMREMLGVPETRMHVVPLGIATADLPAEVPERPAGAPFTVGYLARVCPEKGLHQLVDAFRTLAEGLPKGRVRLRVAGWVGARDRKYLEAQRKRLADWGLAGAVDFVGEVDRTAKLDFLASLDVLSVPTVYREPKGRYVLEALAQGIPVVEPRHGAFPELIAATGGGLLVEPGSTEDLATALRRLHDEPALRAQLGRQGRLAVRQRFNAEVLAEATLVVYRGVLQETGRPAAA